MKKLILAGAALLATSGAILIANNNSSSPTGLCCDKSKCEQGVCKPTPECPNPAECCKQ